MRGWTFVDDGGSDSDESDLKKKIREEMINKLASEWNDAHKRMEDRQFRCQDDIDDENDFYHERMMDHADDAEAAALNKGASEEEAKAAREACIEQEEKDRRKQESELGVRLDVIEELLGELGARMMRPYEHWNEDERYMEYMENRYEEDERY